MYTYQDLLSVGNNEYEKGCFCWRAVSNFKESKEYKEAVVGERYYNKHNETIENYQKYLYTVAGKQVPDLFSSNYKLKTTFFRRLCIQQVQYVLGNGLTLNSAGNKEKLGKDFDFKLQLAAKRAMASGRSFGFWNLDHLEIFSYVDTPTQPGFCPLYSEETAELMGGIRFWLKRVGERLIFRCTLFEPDGYTEYKQIGENRISILKSKRGYKITTKTTKADGEEERIEENYNSLPIVQLYANDSHESELNGIRECIDCYDFIKSGMANDIDDLSGFYWILKNNGGMDDKDLAQFIQRMRMVRAAVVEDVDEIQTNTPNIPTEARMKMLELLRKDIYEDFQSLDVSTLSASAKTTQEIKAAYQAQDNKCADFEYYLIDFCDRILELAGIDDEPTFVWNRVINQQEQTNMVLSAANYLSDECVIKLLPFLTPELAEMEIKTRNIEMLNQFNADDDLIDDGNPDDDTNKNTTVNTPEDGDED